MAIPDGKPATDFSAMNREWVRAVAEEAAESGGGIPAPENPSNGDLLTYNSTSQKWEAADPPASGIPAPASPSDGDVLTYDSSTSAWVAEEPSGGGGVLLITDTAGTLNKTYSEIYAAFTSGIICIIHRVETEEDYELIRDNIVISLSMENNGGDILYFVYTTELAVYSAEATTDYPATDSGGGDEA